MRKSRFHLALYTLDESFKNSANLLKLLFNNNMAYGELLYFMEYVNRQMSMLPVKSSLL